MNEDGKWLISLVALDEARLEKEGYPQGQELSSLPDLLAAAIEGLSPAQALDFDTVYLLTDEQKAKVKRYLEAHALPYHEYAVETRGERCTNPACTEHTKCVVIQLHDRRSKSQGTR